MRNRLLTFVGCVAVAAAAAWLDSGSLAAQAPAAKAGAGPRTTEGRPDFSGIYNVATITPVDRPAQYGNRLSMTEAEAAAIEGYEVKRNEDDRAPVDPNRTAPKVGGETAPTKSFLEGLFRGGGGAVGGYNLVWLNPGDRIAVVDGQRRTSLIVDPPDGRVPPMKPEARQRNARFLATRVSPDAAEGAHRRLVTLLSLKPGALSRLGTQSRSRVTLV
jgi:hypothetical protein